MMSSRVFTLSLLLLATLEVQANFDLSPADRLALRGLLLQDAYNYGTREDENTDSNELHIPAFTYISGGAGEGKQQTGPANFPNAQMAVPEIDSQKYQVPPNPCVPGRSTGDNKIVHSRLFEGLKCACNDSWGEDIQTDCADPANIGCCILNMEDRESFVDFFQSQQGGKDNGDGITNVQKINKKNEYHEGEKRNGLVAKKSPHKFSKRNSYDLSDQFASRSNRFLDGQDRIHSVVAKKSPRYLDSNGSFM
ncbi:uncharacterized protein [Ptychodera flava]|uniref:uncharacterized protein n=1 Tax=Ptychodera flava TaxID=63121 RepID=UPI003969BC9C